MELIFLKTTTTKLLVFVQKRVLSPLNTNHASKKLYKKAKANCQQQSDWVKSCSNKSILTIYLF